MNNNTRLNPRFVIGFFLVSFALLYLEILINRIFSYIIWSNLAYLVISIALLGLGAGAVWDAVVLKPPARVGQRLAIYSIMASITLVAAFLIISLLPMKISFYAILLIVIYYILSFIPFFFLGLTLAIIFRVYVKQVGWIYGINMAAGGMACLAALGSLRLMGADYGILLSAALLSMAAVLFTHPENRNIKISGGVLSGIWIVLIFLQAPLFNFQASLLKEISFFRQSWPDFKLEYQKWTPVGRVDVFSSPSHSILSIGKKSFLYKGVHTDGAAGTAIIQENPELENTNFYRGTLYGQGYLIGHRNKVLIIGVGGGSDIKTALYFKAKEIIGVEVNKEIIRLVRGRYRDFAGPIYDQPGVKIVHSDGRSFLSRSINSYDLIHVSGVDTASALHFGAHMHSENYIFTKEAFIDYFQHLRAEGLLMVTQYEPDPPRVILRVCSIALSALREMQVEHPEKNFIAISQGIFSTVMIKKTPFRPEEIEAYLERLDQSQIRHIFNYELYHFFDERADIKLLYAPEHLKQNAFSNFFQAASLKQEDKFIRSYDYDISVTTDNSPFFYKYYNWQLRLGRAGFIGFYVLLLQLLQSAVLCLIFIYLPIRAFRSKNILVLGHHRMIAIYFLCLGLGYMFVEITLIQRLSLYLGHPMYSMALVLGALLISSGMGAALFQGISLAEKRVVFIAALLIVFCLVIICLWLLPVLIEKTLSWNLVARFIAGGFIVVLVGLFMGMPFPAGLKILGASESHAVPWAFGINAAASVVGSILCVFLAMEIGFTAVLITAAILYLLAGLIIHVFPATDKKTDLTI